MSAVPNTFRKRLTLANMSEIPPVTVVSWEWSAGGVSDLVPTGIVTLLRADVDDASELWQNQPDEMGRAITDLNGTLSRLVSAHHGVCPVGRREADSFVIAFARASDAVACALDLQRSRLAPIRLRIGLHTGETQLDDAGYYTGTAIDRTTLLSELGHGGQTVLSGTTADLVVDLLPDGVWLNDLGTHVLRGLSRPERVVQLCHRDLPNDFPELRVSRAGGAYRLPNQRTSFVGRTDEMADVRQLLDVNRMVTLTGAGGVGKTRLATQIAGEMAGDYPGGIWYVDLVPITDPALVTVATSRSLGLPDQPGRSNVDTIVDCIADRRMLVLFDNCEHLIDACAALFDTLLAACPALTLLATSREPIAVAGEQTRRVPPLAVESQAVELFVDRARLARPEFSVVGDDAAAVCEICRRLDGMPLAIELAAARVRALSLTEIVDGLHDRFRLLTGGSRTAVRRQQTLRASVDWSHALLSDPERVLLRRLSVFSGGFDLDGAQAVAAGGQVHHYEVVDLLTLLVDKSLLNTENTTGRTRYRLLETVRQYALEKLRDSGEADSLRTRHRDHYAGIAAALDAPSVAGHERRLNQVESEIDNLRAAFAWSRDTADTEAALALAASLQPLWRSGGRQLEGMAWLDSALADYDRHLVRIDPGVYARALAGRVSLDAVVGITDHLDRAQQALSIAREIGDPVPLARALAAYGGVTAYNADIAVPALTEAVSLAQQTGDTRTLAEALTWRTYAAAMGEGDPVRTCSVGEQARSLADATGDGYLSRTCGWFLGLGHTFQGNLDTSVDLLSGVIAEAAAMRDILSECAARVILANTLAYRGDTDSALDNVHAAIDLVTADANPAHAGIAYASLAFVNLSAGNLTTAGPASDSATRSYGPSQAGSILDPNMAAQIAWLQGDLDTARCLADAAVSVTGGGYRAMALTTRYHIAVAHSDLEQAERDAYDALSTAASVGAFLFVPDALECVASLPAIRDQEAARLFGAADAARRRMATVRFSIYRPWVDSALKRVRKDLTDTVFDDCWADGAALSADDAICYAQRGRGERKRPSSGWGSLTPTELEVTRLAGEGLGNKEIGAQLFISPRTVQTHLTHVYAKLGLATRVQLAREALRHTEHEHR